jgi:hypothetical protein
MHSRTARLHKNGCPLQEFDTVDRLFILAMLAGLGVIALVLILHV